MNATTAPSYRLRLMAVVLVAAWAGAFAATSAPATDAPAVPKPGPDCYVVADPLHPGTGTWIC